LGQWLVEWVEKVLGHGVIKQLPVERAFLNGTWLTTLWRHGTTVMVGVREIMAVLTDMLGLAR
jgi:hypothetical protein